MKTVNISKVLKNIHFVKTNPFGDFSQKLIDTYSFIEFIPNFTNVLYMY
jgi:hypothetical protein